MFNHEEHGGFTEAGRLVRFRPEPRKNPVLGGNLRMYPIWNTIGCAFAKGVYSGARKRQPPSAWLRVPSCPPW